MFFVIIYSAIDQGYIGLSLASCHKDEIWDLRAELGLIWDHFRALVPIGTKSQIWDIITSTVLVIWIFSFPRPNFPKPKPRLFSETKYFETETETLKNLAKVSRPDLNQDFSTYFEMKFGKFGTYKQNWNFRDQNLGL